MMTLTSQAQRYLERLDIGYSYRLAKRMEEHCTNPVLGYRTAGSPAEIATGDMLAAEMKKIGFSKVWKDAITVDAWEFEKAELSFTDAEGRERHVQLGAYQTNFVTDGPTAYELVYAGKGTEADYEGLDVNGKLVLVEINQRNEWWINYPVYQSHLKGAAALIAVQTGGYGEVDDAALNAQDIAGPPEAAAFSISRKDAGVLKELLADSATVAVTLDAFFAQLRQTIVPLIEKIRATKQIDDAFLYRHYPVEIQRKLSDYLMEVMGIDRTHCGIAETEHPFTTNFNNKDVRITTHYFEDNLVSSMFSVIHEGGHALYELGADDCYNYTALAGGVSMGIHESQSRFYENIIGRSPAYVHAVFPKLKELFPEQLADVDENMFYRAINKAEPSLIRTEADELTYCLHIMVRYEIEKQLIGGTLAVKDVPAEWKRLYKKYLGVDVPSDREGCLQDSHWSGGSIGYFPSYALGSAYGAQMLHKMQEEIGDIWADVAKGDLSKVTDWLRSHIHRYASFKKPGELFESVCGKFDAKYYTDYLTEKYTKLYGL